MKFSARSFSDTLRTDLLVLGISKGGALSACGRRMDRKTGGLLSRLIRRENLKGKAGESRLMDLHKIPGLEAVLLAGLGQGTEDGTAALRVAAARGVKGGNKLRAKKI